MQSHRWGKIPILSTKYLHMERWRVEQFELHATCKQARIWFDTDRIQGSCWEIDSQTLMLNWIRKDIPKSYFYEMIQINEASDTRSRVWHWFENDVLIKRVCISETKAIT